MTVSSLLPERMFFDNAKRFEKVEEVKRPYTDAVNLFNHDRIGSRNTAIKIVDGWRRSPSPSTQNEQFRSLSTRSISQSPPLPDEGLLNEREPSPLPSLQLRGRSRSSSPRGTMQSSQSSKRSFLTSSHKSTSPVSDRLSFEIAEAPGPGAYLSDQSTLNVKGSLPFAPTKVDKRKTKFEVPNPGPGSYYQASSMVTPSFNAHVNDKVRKKKRDEQGKVMEDQPPQPIKKHPILVKLDDAVAKEPRSTREERSEVRKSMKNVLGKLKDLKVNYLNDSKGFNED